MTAHHDYLPAMGRHWLLPLYDPFTRLLGVGRLHERLIDRAGIGPGRRVLEIGTGTGNLLRALTRRRPDVEAVGIDPDPAALRRASRKSPPNVEYQRAFADDLPLPDDAFDRVLSALMLHHLGEDERSRALREVARVLRPGGEVHIVDFDGSPSRHLSRRARANPHLAGSRPDLVVAALTEAGLADAAETGRERVRFGGVVFYRAVAR